MQCGYVYLESAAMLPHHDGAQRKRVELLPLLRLRFLNTDGSKKHHLPRVEAWMLHCADPVARLGTMATFFPLVRTVYIKRGNKHSVGALAQYMMTKLNWKVFAFNSDVPQSRAEQAEGLAVPVHSWFKTRP